MRAEISRKGSAGNKVGTNGLRAGTDGRTLQEDGGISGKFEDLGTLGDVAAAPAKFGAVVQDDFVFTMEPGKEFADGFETNQAAAVDADEELRVERVLQGIEGAPEGMSLLAAVEEKVIAVGFDPGNIADRNEKGARVFMNEEAIGEAAFALHLFEHFAKARYMGIAG
jgi:hypothetical protein